MRFLTLPDLLFFDLQSRGENEAAIQAATRNGLTLGGGKYEIYGLDENQLWDRINATEDACKESTWIRLIQRELPDI